MEIKEIISLFCKVTDWSESDVFNVQIIGGMTNYNFLVTLKTGEQFVFRKAGNSSNELINRQYEYANSLLVQELNLTPDTIYFSIETGYKVTRYIDNAKTLTPFSISKYWQKICEILYNLHNSDIRFINVFDWKQEFELYKKIAEEVGVVLEGKFLEIEKIAIRLYDRLQDIGIELVPCHNDLVAANIIMNNNEKIYLIDWEYSGMNDIAWDIAALFSENSLSSSVQEKFLEKYFRQNQNKILIMKEKILIFQILQNVLWYIWTAIKEAKGDDFGTYREQRLSAAISEIKLYNQVYTNV